MVDFATILQPGTMHPFVHLKAAQFSASMRVRNLFTSDLKFHPKNLPKARPCALSRVPLRVTLFPQTQRRGWHCGMRLAEGAALCGCTCGGAGDGDGAG